MIYLTDSFGNRISETFSTVDRKKECMTMEWISVKDGLPEDRIMTNLRVYMNDEDEENDDELFDGFDDCQHCGKEFDEIDHEYQICSYCLYDSERKIFVKGKRKPQWEGDF